MASHICIFEDIHHHQFLPLAYFRPVYNLRSGAASLKDKILLRYPKIKVTLHCRSYLADYMRQRNPGLLVNEIPVDSCLFINGRVVADEHLARRIPLVQKQDVVYVSDNQVVAAHVSGQALKKIKRHLNQLFSVSDFDGLPRVGTNVEMVSYPWDLVQRNGEQLLKDFEAFLPAGKGIKKIQGSVHKGAYLVNEKEITIGEESVVKPGAVLDASDGPIVVGKNVQLLSHSVLMGPCYIGDGSWIKAGAHIYGNNSIGPVCKIGGEIEESIIHGYANKQHSGFLGHSYVGAWANMGAGTNNSDLKNNYGTIRMQLGTEQVDTGLQFVGLIFGDHSKSAINSMFNTGTVVGVCSNIFGFGFPPKYVPSFSWGAAGETFTTFAIDKAVEVARRVMARRAIQLTPIEERLFKKIFDLTSEDRRRRGMPS